MSAMTGVSIRLIGFITAASQKLAWRAKRPPDPAKWPVDAVDESGRRDWRKTGCAFLFRKLDEETEELRKEVTFVNALALPTSDELSAVGLEACDVALVAFMIAEAAGVDWDATLAYVERKRKEDLTTQSTTKEN